MESASEEILRSRPDRLISLMELALADVEPSAPEQLEQALRKALLSRLPWACLTPGTESLPGSTTPAPPFRVGQLLTDPQPCLEDLKRLKDHAKALRHDPDATLPPELATLIYFASLAAALVRCGVSISRLPGRSMLEGWKWALAQPWLEPALTDLLRHACAGVSE